MNSDLKLFLRPQPPGGRLAASQAWSKRKLAQIPRREKILILMACALVTSFAVLAPPLLQSPSYHDFADRRTILDIPDFWDVISNSPFLVIGLMGLFKFRDQASRILFFGFFGTSLGSAYYHLAPDNARLFWDRLPMTIAFMALFAIAIKQRKLTVPLVLLGIGSVIWWRVTGNLWPYGLVQFGTMAALLVIAARREAGLWPVFVFYGLSKISEHFDQQIFSIFPLSGHTIKHLLAGVATLCIYRWIRASRFSLIMGDTESRFDAFREPVSVIHCPAFGDRSSSPNEFPSKEAW
jgi:hypothetical protein